MLMLCLVFGLSPALAGCGLFRSSTDAEARKAETAYPDLADLPGIPSQQSGRQAAGAPDKAGIPGSGQKADAGADGAAASAEQEEVLRGLQTRRLLAELERDVLGPDMLERLPQPPQSRRTPLLPASLLRERESVQGDATLAPPPSALPPVLPAGGAPAERPGDAAQTP